MPDRTARPLGNRATVTVYNGAAAYHVTGPIKREYPKGLTIEDERGVVLYATFDRCTIIKESKGYLW
ncbi:hypothetical protein P106B_78 [Rhizobium phage vB_RglS_P106B]|uniref:Uncharacterized protein n=1 Tax=Rhizobium phage vB_RglS_P106B TaxID=1458697 RepID=W6EKJ7_9CAUD|nr:hypothetical protein P106B_78 [Rhizobium phage vB_RglS_P106B]AHJ10761.1 hypothetical protein P106B_78 [Rhizobium phage vB_RglS_P106B]